MFIIMCVPVPFRILEADSKIITTDVTVQLTDVIVSFYRDPAAFLRISIPYIIWWLAKRFDLKSIVAGHVTKHLKRWLAVFSPAVGETSE